jgi:hypothetical protein
MGGAETGKSGVPDLDRAAPFIVCTSSPIASLATEPFTLRALQPPFLQQDLQISDIARFSLDDLVSA